MNKLLSIAFILIGHYVFGQPTIWFQMQRVDYCTKETKIDSSLYYLVDVMGEKHRNLNGKVILPFAGEYEIYHPSQPDVEFPIVEIKTEENIYTHYETKIKVLPGHSLNRLYVYKDCNGILNGLNEDFYENGNLRLRGSFKDGIPKDSITLFYPNGNIQKSIIFFPKHLYFKEYDSTGALQMINHISTKTADYYKTTYYPNGNINSNEKFKKGFQYLTEYYAGKKIKKEIGKNFRKEYTANGVLETEYKWRAKTSQSAHNKIFEVTRTTYTDTGNKLEEIKYITESVNRQPSLAIAYAKHYTYWKQYDNTGKETLLLKNISKEDIMKRGGFREQ